MRHALDPADRAKLTSAYHAMRFVEDGMAVGLGTGSTAAWLVKLLGARKHIEGLDIETVSTSEVTESLARKVGLVTTNLNEAEWLDLTIDGADEFDPALCLIKGAGGALLREKIVATSSDRMIVISDPSKQVEQLGQFPLPVEVVQFGVESTANMIRERLANADVEDDRIELRIRDGDAYETDEGHFILDLYLNQIGDVDALAADLLSVPGVVETGLFIDIADTVVVGAATGEADLIRAGEPPEVRDDMDEARLNAFLTHIGT
ncbi:MAG: ribose-5-phosphate isomerase RpiA [Pseudomonadota bacterium]